MNSYVEHVRHPVGRGVEKFLGWFAWLIILGVTVLSLFAALVLLNDPVNISRLESLINRLNINVTSSSGELLSSSEVALNIQNGIWLFIIFLIIVLIFNFIGLVLMRWRVFSGLVFLLLAFITIPLIVVLVPVFLFIVSMMLFFRKDKMIPVQNIPPEKANHFTERQNREQDVKHAPKHDHREPEHNKDVQLESNEENYKQQSIQREQDPVAPNESSHSEVLSRTQKNKKKNLTQENEQNIELENETKPQYEDEHDGEQRDQYQYETTQADDYQVPPRETKKEKKEKKEKPTATADRRANYEKRMNQQKKYFDEQEQGLNEKTKQNNDNG